MEQECPFCNPIVKSACFAEDLEYYALYNHAPVVPGHSLIIPSKHLTSIFELTDEEYSRLFLFARKITDFLTSCYNTKEFDISLQQGFNAGQSVEHLHLHLIPRKENDLPNGVEWFDKLNENKAGLLDSGRILNDQEFERISIQLRERWKLFLDKK